jgi:hypothetical protein
VEFPQKIEKKWDIFYFKPVPKAIIHENTEGQKKTEIQA